MDRYEAAGLSPEQIERMSGVVKTYQAAGIPVSLDDLVRFAFTPTKTEIERLAHSFDELARALKYPWYVPILWAIEDALSWLRGIFWELWWGSGQMCDPESYEVWRDPPGAGSHPGPS